MPPGIKIKNTFYCNFTTLAWCLFAQTEFVDICISELIMRRFRFHFFTSSFSLVLRAGIFHRRMEYSGLWPSSQLYRKSSTKLLCHRWPQRVSCKLRGWWINGQEYSLNWHTQVWESGWNALKFTEKFDYCVKNNPNWISVLWHISTHFIIFFPLV